MSTYNFHLQQTPECGEVFLHHLTLCVCVCVCACVRMRVRVRVCVCVCITDVHRLLVNKAPALLAPKLQ